MHATIGKYTMSIDGYKLICTHPTGISFDFTIDEALGLMRFIAVYQDAMTAAQQHPHSGGKSAQIHAEHVVPAQNDHNVDTSINFLQQEEENE